MKKFFYLAMIALVGVAFASCKGNDPDKDAAYLIEVSDVTATTATIKVTPKTVGETYYWDIMSKEDYDAIVAGEYAAEGFADIPTYCTENISYVIQIYETMGYQVTWADMVYDDVDEYTYEELDAETEYVVYALPANVEKEECSAPVVTKVFKTGSIEKSENKLTLSYADGALSIKTTNNDPYFFWIESKADYDEYQKDFSEASLKAEIEDWIYSLAQYGLPVDEAVLSGNQNLDPANDFWNVWFQDAMESGQYVAMAAPYADAVNGTPVYCVFDYAGAVAAPVRDNMKVANGVKRVNTLFKNYRKVAVK